MSRLKGLHYRNALFYRLQNWIKLGWHYDQRFRIASEFMQNGDSVLDVCSGFGQLKKYLPSDCHYQCIEASAEFAEILKRKNIPVSQFNLHEGMKTAALKADVAVMIVSLCHFRDTSVNELLESLKALAARVVIVEDVLLKRRGRHSLVQHAMNFFCQTDYYRPVELFTVEEFESLMKRHGYVFRRYNRRYCTGLWPGIT